METIIKEKGVKAIRDASKDAIEKHIASKSLEANQHLIDAAYAESLIPSVDHTIQDYKNLISLEEAKLADIDERAQKAKEANKPREAYNITKERKPIEARIRTLKAGEQKMIERKSTALEKVHAHRMDAQATMHRIAFFVELLEKPDTLADQLVKHAKDLVGGDEEAVKEEETAPEAEETATETAPEATGEAVTEENKE